MNSVDCLLSPAELIHAGQLLGVNPSAVSPLGGAVAGAVDATRLVAAGLVADGGLTADARAALGVLARASAYASLILSGDGTYEEVVYLDGAARVSLREEGGQVRLIAPATDATALLSAAFGEDTANSVEFDSTFTATEAAVVLALVDLQRRRELQGVLDEREPGLAAIAIADLYAWLSRTATTAQWLADLLRDTLGLHPDRTAIDAAIASLAAEGAVTQSSAGLAPSALIGGLANRLLIVATLARVRAGRAVGDSVSAVDIRIAQGQGGRHLLWEADATGRVHLQLLAGAQVAALLEPLFTDPDAIDVAPGGRSCPGCGAVAAAGARFCTSCGHTLAA